MGVGCTRASGGVGMRRRDTLLRLTIGWLVGWLVS